ncbi:MAG TPA: flavin prenyltransferase UbiX [Candidatus Omnitrophota bacterium]|nr:flavin prenyltransferase UbiX [Candidatus Omnitrophota bacterium]HPS37473.1 flavin prenyltransferase UbiX [Candidatus Omnitrophota bacterium]
MKPYVVAMTGASGAIYGIRLLEILAEQKIPVELVISDTARIVMREEGSHSDFEALSPLIKKKDRALFYNKKKEPVPITIHDFHDFTAPIASGSYPTEGMIIIPCSMGTLGAVASGLSQNLIHRAADCTIKEGRKFVLVPRETPLSAIHLENMLKLARLGVKIVPPMPAFYGSQQKVSDLVDFVVGKVLDQMDIPHALYPRWVGSFSRYIPERS